MAVGIFDVWQSMSTVFYENVKDTSKESFTTKMFTLLYIILLHFKPSLNKCIDLTSKSFEGSQMLKQGSQIFTFV